MFEFVLYFILFYFAFFFETGSCVAQASFEFAV